MTKFGTSTILLSLLYLTDVLHTVGPINGSESKLRSCYERCLQLVLENNIRSVVSQTNSPPLFIDSYLLLQAFCCIATGVYGESKSIIQNITIVCVGGGGVFL